MNETGSSLVITVETVDSTDPDSSLIIAKQDDCTIIANTPLVGIVMQEHPEVIAVVAVQSVVGSNPDATVLILTETVDQSAGKQIGRNEMARLCRKVTKRQDEV